MPLPSPEISKLPESCEHVVEIRNNLPVYLKKVGQGKNVLIKKYDKPFAVLSPYCADLPENVEKAEYTTTELRPRISELLHSVHYNRLYVILTKHSKKVAVLKPLDYDADSR